MRTPKTCYGLLLASLGLLAATQAAGAELFEVPLSNPSFTKGIDKNGIPLDWSTYGGGGKDQKLKVIDVPDAGKALWIIDGDPATEIGVVQTFSLQGGKTYQVTAKVRAVPGVSTVGAYLQLRFLPSHQYVQTGLTARSAEKFAEVSLQGSAPAGTTQGMIYLYTHRDPTPQVLVTDVRLRGGLPPAPPPPPAPVPPQYEELKDLHREISLVRGGKPDAVIVAPGSGTYRTSAEAIQGAIEKRTGVKLPIVSDESADAAVPLRTNLIVLGNRSTNRTTSALYDLFYCLVDLKYPGPEGYVLRSVHDPFGNGRSVLIVGGSDVTGVEAGAGALANLLAKVSAAKGEMAIGWTMVTRLGKGAKVPTDIRQFETWEASKGYGSVGYFGWCSISKRMAMYYMTGDEANAREFVRLSFPDREALKDIEAIDGEQIENKHDPLAGFYHYNAHMAILFWDLIEESPAFTDQQRLKITNAFARQLNHRKEEGIYGLRQAPAGVSSRHGQWSAIALYCLGRYFDKYYPHPVWAQCKRGGELAFQSLHEHAWIAGENDNLYWYNTGIAPALTYMVLTGDRKPLECGVLGELLRGQEILVSGRVPDWALAYASMDFLNKAAYLTGDGRWITYRDRTGVDTNAFRLGQSFWPDKAIEPKLPGDMAGKWSIHRLPQPAWEARGSGVPWERSFYYGSYRSAADASGDYVLLDGFNGASRNPYHTFDILELRLAGRTILEGYHNQVLTSADGMVERAVAMDAVLLHSDVVGPTATAVGEVPKAAFCNWRRTLTQRTGRYALVVDDLTFRTDSQNMKVSTTWQVPGGSWDAKQQAILIPDANASMPVHFELRSCDIQQISGSGVVTMNWNGAVKKGEHRIAFSLIGPTVGNALRGVPRTANEAPVAGSGTPRRAFPTVSPAAVAQGHLACVRLAKNAAALALPEAALAVAGEYKQVKGEFVILAADHLYGHGLTSAGIGGILVSSDAPVDLDWDFPSGVLNVVAVKPAALQLILSAPDDVRLDGAPAKPQLAGRTYGIVVPEGRHVIRGASLPDQTAVELKVLLPWLLEPAGGGLPKGRSLGTLGDNARAPRPLPPAFAVQVGGEVLATTQVPSPEGPRLCVAEGNTLHVLDERGREVHKLQTDGKIRVLRWWDEPKLLLAGCVDEKVIAFDAEGKRRWVFTSQMDPAVYEAAKTYWFKSAPGHEGIHGLFTGEFDGGKSRCFVGSACTLEILNERGALVKRTPIFWGPCWKFLLAAGPAGSRNLLVSQWHNGSDELVIVNSRSMADSGRGYYGVPAGHTFVGGWDCQNRTGLFHEDLDGDGKPEIATAINGTWNRVSVYSEQGKPLFNAQFGPGADIAPRAQMRDMDLADLNGDGAKEIVVGISEGLVVALSHRCEKIWSTRLSSPPLSLRCVKPLAAKLPWVVVGCDDGTVAVLDSKGVLTRLGKVTGRPTRVEVLQTPGGPLAVLATSQGQVHGFKVE